MCGQIYVLQRTRLVQGIKYIMGGGGIMHEMKYYLADLCM